MNDIRSKPLPPSESGGGGALHPNSVHHTPQNTTNPADGKLAPKWEGPYKIESEAGKGAYKLINIEGKPLPRSWNAIHLKLYFI